ncbi:MAG: hypothetical protein IPM51_05905 [Sphingobacteriaceae bacterium]|nr:hypothetical protein [Sphingobacteriaceae bacterium]
MKKNVILVAAFVVIAFACKKDRTCECTVTKKGTSSTQGKVEQNLFGFPVALADTTFETNVSEIQTYEIKMEKVTKKTAKGNCYKYTEPYNEKTITSVPAASFNLSVVVTDKGEKTFDCKLK